MFSTPLVRAATRTAAFGALVLALVMAPVAATAGVTTTTDQTPRVNGTVYAIAQVGDLTVIGGDFTSVGGKPRLNAAAIRADGTLDPSFNPSPDGVVRAVAASSDGSMVYLGGRFDNAGGVPRANLAAVDPATGAAIGSWRADTTGGSPGVTALVTTGDRLYAGGTFSGIDDTGRASLVALDPAGDIIGPFRPRTNAGIKDLAASPDGEVVYVAGAFSRLGADARPWGVGAVHASDGSATGFAPTRGGDLTLALGLSPDGSRLYFSSPDNNLFAYDLSSNSPVWVRKTSGDVQAIAPSATEVYIGGHFSQIVTYKIKRTFLASLDPANGTVTPWQPDPLGGTMGVWALTITPTALLAGGTFTTVAGETRVRFARFPGTP